MRLYYTVYAVLQGEVDGFVSDRPMPIDRSPGRPTLTGGRKLASMVLVASPSFAQHVTPPGHPERVERAQVHEASPTDGPFGVAELFTAAGD